MTEPVTRDDIYGKPISDNDLIELLHRAIENDQDELADEIGEILDRE